jgi:hypothetical protein
VVSTFEKHVRTLDAVTQAKILANLGLFERGFGNIGARIAPNLRRDRFLSIDAAKDFADFFLHFDPAEAESAVLSKYQSVCRRHSLTGGEIRTGNYPPNLGRAVEAGKFKYKLATRLGLSLSQVSRLFDRLERNTPTSADLTILVASKMSDFGCWVTWDLESSGHASPFAFSSSRCAIEIRAALGLERSLKDIRLPLLIFEYPSSAVEKLFRPTMADADAFLRFLPCDPPPPAEQDWFGLTSPWLDQVAPRTTSLPRRPEAVHAAIYFPGKLVCQTAYPQGDLGW